MPFWLPLPASPRMQLLYPNQKEGLFAKILCKDAIGNFLGLPRAPFRTSTFNDVGDTTGDALNDGRVFVINEKIGAKPYILRLRPGTSIEMGNYNYNETNTAPVEVYKKSLSIFLNSHTQVWRLLYWLTNKANHYIDDIKGVRTLEGYVPNDNLGKIIGIVTPSGRTYNTTSILFDIPIGMTVPGYEAAPSPSPSPAPP